MRQKKKLYNKPAVRTVAHYMRWIHRSFSFPYLCVTTCIHIENKKDICRGSTNWVVETNKFFFCIHRFSRIWKEYLMRNLIKFYYVAKAVLPLTSLDEYVFRNWPSRKIATHWCRLMRLNLYHFIIFFKGYFHYHYVSSYF